MTIERIMILDEDDANLLFFEVLLKELGLTDVTVCQSGHDALEKIEPNRIQFVVVAWEMTIIPGTIFMQKVRSHRRRKHLPYLIYSKRMGEEDVRLAKELGLKNLAHMPFSKDAIGKLIRDILAEENSLPKAEILLRKIEAYLADGKPNEALKLFDAKLCAPGPYQARSQVLLGETWMHTNQFDKAKEALNIALKVDPENFPALNLMAGLHSRLGEHDESIGILEKLTQQSPKNLTSKINLGSAYVEADRHDEAKKVFHEVGVLDDDNPALKDEQAKLAFKEGDLDLATRLIAETENGEMLAKTFNNMAIGMVHKKEFDKAIELYANALKLLADKARLHLLRYNLGLALSKKGDLEASFVELAKSYQCDPSFEKAYAALAKLGKRMKDEGKSFDVGIVRECNRVRREFQGKQKSGGDDGKTDVA